MAVSPVLQSYVLDSLERAGSTFVQQFVVLLLATGSAGLISHQDWATAADAALFAAILSLITSVLTFTVPALPPALDLSWRVVKTFGQSFFGVLAGDQFTHSVIHADWKAALAVAVPVAMTALLKGLAAFAAPWSVGASLLPTGPAGAPSVSVAALDYGPLTPADPALADQTYLGTAVVADHAEAGLAEASTPASTDPPATGQA
jgi:uncharacterized membrane protein AbrB (regulator of aidB expression)